MPGYDDRHRADAPRRHRSRSRSPRASDRNDRDRRRRSPPNAASSSSRHHHHHRPSRRDRPAASLPFDARPLSKSDAAAFRPLFAYYLDLQKGKSLAGMDEREARGRWKSFVGRWNAGELSEGWYDPEMFASAADRAEELGVDDVPVPVPAPHAAAVSGGGASRDSPARRADSDDSDEDMGPALPPSARGSEARAGPGIPRMDDVIASREQRAEDAARARREDAEDLRFERKADRREQREKLDELVPRAEAGTRERRLEKRAAVNEKMKGFREGSPGAAAVADGELMGGGDGVEEIRQEREREERKKTEREIRREEVARAKAVEREERVREYKEREEGTMKALKELAKARFG